MSENPVCQTGVVVLIFKKEDQRMCSNYRGITLLSFPGQVCTLLLWISSCTEGELGLHYEQ